MPDVRAVTGVATGSCGCGWTLHYDPVLGETSLDIDQVRDLLNALGFDAPDLHSVEVTPDRITVRRIRTNAQGASPTIVETVVTHR